MSCNTILACIELAANHAVLAEGTANCLTNLANSTIWIELLADCAGRGDD
jgi:hypothetical protein